MSVFGPDFVIIGGLGQILRHTATIAIGLTHFINAHIVARISTLAVPLQGLLGRAGRALSFFMHIADFVIALTIASFGSLDVPFFRFGKRFGRPLTILIVIGDFHIGPAVPIFRRLFESREGDGIIAITITLKTLRIQIIRARL